MGDIRFLIQYHSTGSSSRGLQAGGYLFSIHELLDEEYMSKRLKGSWRLLYTRDPKKELTGIISMPLWEFETVFGEYINWNNEVSALKHLLGFNGSPCVFRAEICKKYGPKAIGDTTNYTTKYVEGSVITAPDKRRYMYLGDFEKLVFSWGSKRVEMKGHMYFPLIGVSQYDDYSWYTEILCWMKDIIVYNPNNLKKFCLSTKKRADVNQIDFISSFKSPFNDEVSVKTEEGYQLQAVALPTPLNKRATKLNITYIKKVK